MKIDEIDVVAGLSLFSGLPKEHLQPLFQAAFLQRFPPGVTLARQGMKADFLHAVTSGAVELFATYAESEATVAVRRVGALVLLGPVVCDEPLVHSARTLEPSQILMVPAEPVRELMRNNPGFATAAAREIAREQRSTVKELQSHKLRTSLQRLANWILLAHRERGGASGFVLPFQKRTLASLIGTSPENLSRNFQALAQNGVQVRGNRLLITDIGKVMDLARPAPELDEVVEISMAA
jgi:CRP/FNR family transcriptional activator FtrB